MTRTEQTVHGLVRAGITHVVGIPDNTSGPLFHDIPRHPTVRLVNASREGEAVALAAGLWLGGASPLVVIQNTGLLESGDALRGTVLRMAAGIPMVVTGRGYTRMLAEGIEPEAERTVELLTRPDIDSAALFTEPTLRAWGIPFSRCGPEDDPVHMIRDTIDDARALRRPVALLLLRSLS